MIIRLKEIRLSKGITIRQLAIDSGVSKTQINDIETGKKQPTVLTLCKLAKALEVKTEDLYKCE